METTVLEDKQFQEMSTLEDVNIAIDKTIQEIKISRLREISILEQCDSLESNIRFNRDKGSAFFLLRRIKDPGLTDTQAELVDAIGQKYDRVLTEKLKRNIELKKEFDQNADLIALLKENEMPDLKGSHIEMLGVDSLIDSVSEYGRDKELESMMMGLG